MITVDKEWIRAHVSKFFGKRCVMLVGAGLSVPSGIPDFRSSSGIFSELRKRGHADMFHYRFGVSSETRKIYLEFISKLKALCDAAKPNDAHRLLVEMKRFNKLRVYTQNIDGMERRAGLAEGKDFVLLHGDLEHLKCLYCGHITEFRDLSNGEVECEKCVERAAKRHSTGSTVRRTVGLMHTSIIHYYQPHPDSSYIAKMAENDRNLSLFIVIGTSLKVYGARMLSKFFSKNCSGLRICVDVVKPRKDVSEMFDCLYMGSCDQFMRDLISTLDELGEPLKGRRKEDGAGAMAVADDDAEEKESTISVKKGFRISLPRDRRSCVQSSRDKQSDEEISGLSKEVEKRLSVESSEHASNGENLSVCNTEPDKYVPNIDSQEKPVSNKMGACAKGNGNGKIDKAEREAEVVKSEDKKEGVKPKLVMKKRGREKSGDKIKVSNRKKGES